MLLSTDQLKDMEVIFSIKKDGEATTMYRDYIHARSLDYSHHPSRSIMKALHGKISYLIPEDLRICGENVSAVHSLRYDNLPSYFLVYSVWNKNLCLSWDDTLKIIKDIHLDPVV